MLYLGSNGYCRQRNQDLQRYGLRQHEAFLETIAARPLSTQRETLLEELANHRGEEPQTDDITILGFRL